MAAERIDSDDDVLALVIGAENSIRDAQRKLELASQLAREKGAALISARISLFRARSLQLAEDIRESRVARRMSR